MGILNHYSVQVDWGDCDPAGIVFYPNFYRWMDRGFWLLFESRSLTLEALKCRFGVFGGPLVDTGATFVSPARMGDQLTVTSFVENWGRKSFRLRHEFTCKDKEIASGFETRVWGVKKADGAISAGIIPDEVKALFS